MDSFDFLGMENIGIKRAESITKVVDKVMNNEV
jgi:hypothetical protein